MEIAFGATIRFCGATSVSLNRQMVTTVSAVIVTQADLDGVAWNSCVGHMLPPALSQRHQKSHQVLDLLLGQPLRRVP